MIHPVVIVGPADEPHVTAMTARLHALGAPVALVDATRFPEDLTLSLGDRRDDIVIDGRSVRPAAVYVRNLACGLMSMLEPPGGTAEDWWRAIVIDRERTSMLLALAYRWQSAGVPLYNGLLDSARITKPYQLTLLAEAGLPVPATCWSNDPATVRRFAAGRRVAYKPVVGGAATRELTEDDLTDERLASLATAPVAFQELLPGDDIRVYVLDGEIIASLRIVTDELDFRGHEQSIEPIELPAELQAQCVRATAILGLRFTGMDLKRAADGTLRFLELNPSPMFLGFDELAGTDIAGRFAARLASWAR